MNRLIILLYTSLLLQTCVDPYEFDIKNAQQPLVISSYISDKSFFETIDYPSDGRYFTTIIREGQIFNQKGNAITGAQVLLEADNGFTWQFLSHKDEPGVYKLLNSEFKAVPGIQYRLKIFIPQYGDFESDWQMLPASSGEMGELSLKDNVRYISEFRNMAKERQIVEKRGLNLTVQIPGNPKNEKRFFKWEYEPTWIYIAGRLPPTSRHYKCWVTGKSYLSQYTIGEDVPGDYEKELEFIQVDDNERTFVRMSVLVKQMQISEDYYYFLKELDEQGESTGIFDGPPYNLKTNFHTESAKDVIGQFSVVNENARRIYFSQVDMSNFTFNSTRITCFEATEGFSLGLNPCGNCLDYEAGGKAALDKPDWWID